MWNPSSTFELAAIRGQMLAIKVFFVERMMFHRSRARTIFVTSDEDHELMQTYHMVNKEAHWTVSGCNKQYCSEHAQLPYDHTKVSSTYLGCMKQVEVDVARAWKNGEGQNWMLADQASHMYWIPVKENPNRVIPTPDKFPVQDRPWPLRETATYAAWKQSVVKDMMDILDQHL
jgi:hypothetical protein